jgi:translation initiation factor IF-3
MQPRGPRLNEQIYAKEIRVINAEGQMLGLLPTTEALALAAAQELDLVEVSAEAVPPVCRIMNYSKARFERQKKTTSKRHQPQLKQIRLGAKTGQHDIDVKINKAREFLARGDKVKLNVVFRGRENAHHSRGRELLTAIVKSLEEVATVEQPPRMESGRMMSMLLTAGRATPAAKST